MRIGSDSLLERVGLPEIRLRPPADRASSNDRHRMGRELISASQTAPAGPGPRSLALVGNLETAPELPTDARPVDLTLRAATAKGIGLLYSDGEVDAAHAVLVDAIESSCGQRHHDSAGMVAALHALSEVCIFGGRPELWVPYQQAVGVLGNVVPPLLQLIPRICPDPGAATAVDLQELEQHVNRLQEGSAGHAHTVHVGVAANVVDRMSGCRPALRRVFRGFKVGGGSDWVLRAGILLSVDAVDAGQWAEAETLAKQCVELAETKNRRLLAWSGRSVLALVAAGRGHWELCRALTDGILQWATPRGVRGLMLDAHRARCLAALGRGDHDNALPEPVARTAWTSPRLALRAAFAEALVAPEEHSANHFHAALDIPGIERWLFEVAQVQLAFGERLRRRHATRASREQLAAALATFSCLGAGPWAARADAELKATGQKRHRPDGNGPAPLTPQELEIAELAATGLTNKEIGAKMYLSPRTVSAHLYRIFPKLGITSRAALRDALLARPSPR